MRKCVVCHKDYQESTETQKYCDRLCKRAAYLKITREEYLAQRQERENQFAEEVKKAGEAGYGNCVIFRDDGGYNRQYLRVDGTWTVDREEAARCLGQKEADELARKHGVVFFGGVSEAEPTCGILCFRLPDDFGKWLADNWGEIDADDPSPTERFIQADLQSAVPGEKARALLRAARKDESDGGPEDTFQRS
jgi:hypothetical protein